jgi:hypothetical protein
MPATLDAVGSSAGLLLVVVDAMMCSKLQGSSKAWVSLATAHHKPVSA